MAAATASLASMLHGARIVEARSHHTDPHRPWHHRRNGGASPRIGDSHYAIDLIVQVAAADDAGIGGDVDNSDGGYDAQSTHVGSNKVDHVRRGQMRVVRITEFLGMLRVCLVDCPVDVDAHMDTRADGDDDGDGVARLSEEHRGVLMATTATASVHDATVATLPPTLRRLANENNGDDDDNDDAVSLRQTPTKRRRVSAPLCSNASTANYATTLKRGREDSLSCEYENDDDDDDDDVHEDGEGDGGDDGGGGFSCTSPTSVVVLAAQRAVENGLDNAGLDYADFTYAQASLAQELLAQATRPTASKRLRDDDDVDKRTNDGTNTLPRVESEEAVTTTATRRTAKTTTKRVSHFGAPLKRARNNGDEARPLCVNRQIVTPNTRLPLGGHVCAGGQTAGEPPRDAGHQQPQYQQQGRPETTAGERCKRKYGSSSPPPDCVAHCGSWCSVVDVAVPDPPAVLVRAALADRHHRPPNRAKRVCVTAAVETTGAGGGVESRSKGGDGGGACDCAIAAET